MPSRTVVNERRAGAFTTKWLRGSSLLKLCVGNYSMEFGHAMMPSIPLIREADETPSLWSTELPGFTYDELQFVGEFLTMSNGQGQFAQEWVQRAPLGDALRGNRFVQLYVRQLYQHMMHAIGREIRETAGDEDLVPLLLPTSPSRATWVIKQEDEEEISSTSDSSFSGVKGGVNAFHLDGSHNHTFRGKPFESARSMYHNFGGPYFLTQTHTIVREVFLRELISGNLKEGRTELLPALKTASEWIADDRRGRGIYEEPRQPKRSERQVKMNSDSKDELGEIFLLPRNWLRGRVFRFSAKHVLNVWLSRHQDQDDPYPLCVPSASSSGEMNSTGTKRNPSVISFLRTDGGACAPSGPSSLISSRRMGPRRLLIETRPTETKEKLEELFKQNKVSEQALKQTDARRGARAPKELSKARAALVKKANEINGALDKRLVQRLWAEYQEMLRKNGLVEFASSAPAGSCHANSNPKGPSTSAGTPAGVEVVIFNPIVHYHTGAPPLYARTTCGGVKEVGTIKNSSGTCSQVPPGWSTEWRVAFISRRGVLERIKIHQSPSTSPCVTLSSNIPTYLKQKREPNGNGGCPARGHKEIRTRL